MTVDRNGSANVRLSVIPFSERSVRSGVELARRHHNAVMIAEKAQKTGSDVRPNLKASVRREVA